MWLAVEMGWAAVLLVLLRTFVPIPGFQGLVRLACPMPFVLLAVRRGPRAGLIATVAAYLLLSTFIAFIGFLCGVILSWIWYFGSHRGK